MGTLAAVVKPQRSLEVVLVAIYIIKKLGETIRIPFPT